MTIRYLYEIGEAAALATAEATQAELDATKWTEWVSEPVTPANLAGGALTKENILLTSLSGVLPANAIPLAAYIKVLSAPVSINPATTACFLALGYPGTPTAESAYLQIGGNVIGVAAGFQQHWSGNFLGGVRSQGSPYLTITASGGGAERTAHLAGFSFIAGLRYWQPPA